MRFQNTDVSTRGLKPSFNLWSISWFPNLLTGCIDNDPNLSFDEIDQYKYIMSNPVSLNEERLQ